MRQFLTIGLALALGTACTSASQKPSAGPGDPLVQVESAALFDQGKRLAQEGDLVRSEQYLVAAMDKGHPIEEVLPILIEVCIAGSRYDTALHHARPHLLRDPENSSLRYIVATLYHAIGRQPLAVEHLERVILDAPNEPNAYYTLGKIFWKEKEAERATELMQKYVELAPDGSHAPDARALLVQWQRRMPAIDATSASKPAIDATSASKPAIDATSASKVAEPSPESEQ